MSAREDSISVPGTGVPPAFHSRSGTRGSQDENVVTEFINTFRALCTLLRCDAFRRAKIRNKRTNRRNAVRRTLKNI